MADRFGRTNFTLDAETAALLKRHTDRLERELGFRPSLNQVVSGLIALATKQPDRGAEQ